MSLRAKRSSLACTGSRRCHVDGESAGHLNFRALPNSKKNRTRRTMTQRERRCSPVLPVLLVHCRCGSRGSHLCGGVALSGAPCSGLSIPSTHRSLTPVVHSVENDGGRPGDSITLSRDQKGRRRLQRQDLAHLTAAIYSGRSRERGGDYKRRISPRRMRPEHGRRMTQHDRIL